MTISESDLYAPVKAYLQAQGYEVKAEVGACDLMARRGKEEPLIVELKRSFSLSLILQAVARQRLVDCVYVAVPLEEGRGWSHRYPDIIHLCRRLGLGLLAVRMAATPVVEAHLDPGDYQPRKQTKRAGRLLREFERRVGDPNIGGTTRRKRITAYRQDALRIATLLAENGAMKTREIRERGCVLRATQILQADHYGWFERVARGVYVITPKGEVGLQEFANELPALMQDQ